MSKAEEERVQLVDRDNQPCGGASRREMRKLGLIYRACYILVVNASGDVFMQRRSTLKDMYPGYWDPAAGGIVLEGEGYTESARRELHEELGVGGGELIELFDFFYEDRSNRLWGRAYLCRHEGPFTLQAEEIDEGFFYPPERALAGDLGPTTPDGLGVLQRYMNQT